MTLASWGARILATADRIMRRMVETRRRRAAWGKQEGKTPAEIFAERMALSQQHAAAKRGHRERGTIYRRMVNLTNEGLRKEQRKGLTQ